MNLLLSVLGKIVRIVGVLIMLLPLGFIFIAAGFISQTGLFGIIAAFIAFFLLITVFSALGWSVHNYGLRLELKAKGIESASELRKRMSSVLGERPEELKALEVPKVKKNDKMPRNAGKKASNSPSPK